MIKPMKHRVERFRASSVTSDIPKGLLVAKCSGLKLDCTCLVHTLYYVVSVVKDVKEPRTSYSIATACSEFATCPACPSPFRWDWCIIFLSVAALVADGISAAPLKRGRWGFLSPRFGDFAVVLVSTNVDPMQIRQIRKNLWDQRGFSMKV